MARIEGIRIQHYGALKDITLGRVFGSQEQSLTQMTAVIGKNGAGKSTLFDAFAFLVDCVRTDVEAACASPRRGGFHRIQSQGITRPIRLQLCYKDSETSSINYEIMIGEDTTGQPWVLRERLQQSDTNSEGPPLTFLSLFKGKGLAWRGATEGEPDDELLPTSLESLRKNLNPKLELVEQVELDDPDELGVATLGSLKQHPRIAAFRRFIEGWYLSSFNSDAAKTLPLAGPQTHLNAQGDNLGNVVQFLEREHPERLQYILDRIASKVPGINKIDTQQSPDGRLLLRFNDRGFKDPFYAQQMSDGTLRVFAYLLMLEGPKPPPFVCIEEPETGLYPKLLETLAHEFRAHSKDGSQIFVTTHQPYFVDALTPDEVWILDKGGDGFSTIRRASDDLLVRNLVEQSLPLGSLWYSDYLDS